MTNLMRNTALWALLALALLLPVTSANAACAFQSIVYGQTVNASLSATDCTDDVNASTYYADYYQFTGSAGDKVTLQLSSSSFDPWLVLNFPSGKYTNNDNGGGGTTARIPATSGYYTLPESGIYKIEVTSYTSHSTGNYTLEFAKEASATTLPSAPTNVTAIAGNGSATVAFTPSSIGSGTLAIYWAACGIDTTHLIIVKGSSSPITVTGLSNGTVYYCWALTESTVGYSSNWSKVSNAVTPNSSLVSTDPVTEFYNTNLDHYFLTASSSDASAIDKGSAGPGWIRTGNTFASGGNSPVCRFYGSQSPGPNSHFYTVDPGECASLKQIQASTPITQPRWNFESLDFVSTPPSNGVCPGGTVPVYRAYNNGYARGVDSNHRITSNLTAIQQQVACGWSSEGVVMCAPSGTSSGGTTSCGTAGGGGGGSGGGGGGGSTGAGAVTLLNPNNGANDQSITPTLNWSASGAPTGYWVFISADQNILNGLTTAASTCSGCVIATSTGTTASYMAATGTLQAGTKYYWRVKSAYSTENVLSGIWSFTTTSTTSPPPLGSVGQFDAKMFVDTLLVNSKSAIKIFDLPFLVIPVFLLDSANPDQMIDPLAKGMPGMMKKITNGININFGKAYYLPGGTVLSGSISMSYSEFITKSSMNYALSFDKLSRNFQYLADGTITGAMDTSSAGFGMTLAGVIHSLAGDVKINGNLLIESKECNANPSAGSIDFVSSLKREKITFTKACDGTYIYSTY